MYLIKLIDSVNKQFWDRERKKIIKKVSQSNFLFGRKNAIPLKKKKKLFMYNRKNQLDIGFGLG